MAHQLCFCSSSDEGTGNSQTKEKHCVETKNSAEQQEVSKGAGLPQKMAVKPTRWDRCRINCKRGGCRAHCFITWESDWMVLTGPFSLMCSVITPGAFSLSKTHSLTASLDMWTFVDLDAPFESHWNVCITLYKGLLSSAFCAATSCSQAQSLICAQT